MKILTISTGSLEWRKTDSITMLVNQYGSPLGAVWQSDNRFCLAYGSRLWYFPTFLAAATTLRQLVDGIAFPKQLAR